MPYAIVKDTNGYFVENTLTHLRKEKKPISLQKAKAQLRVLNASEGGGLEQEQYQKYLETHHFGDISTAKETESEKSASASLSDIYKKNQAYQKLVNVFGVPNLHGGVFKNLAQETQMAVEHETELSELEKPYFDYWTKKFQNAILNLWEPGLTQGRLLKYSESRIPSVSGKSKAILLLRSKSKAPEYDYNEEQKQYVGFYNKLKDNSIAIFNPDVSDQYIEQQLSLVSGTPEGRGRLRAIQDLRRILINPNFNYKDAEEQNVQRAKSVGVLNDQTSAGQYKKGYDETVSYINQFGAVYLWNDITLDNLPDKTAYDQGVKYAVIQYRAAWPYQARPPPKKSTWDEVWDAVTTGLEIGLEVTKVVLL